MIAFYARRFARGTCLDDGDFYSPGCKIHRQREAHGACADYENTGH